MNIKKKLKHEKIIFLFITMKRIAKKILPKMVYNNLRKQYRKYNPKKVEPPVKKRKIVINPKRDMIIPPRRVERGIEAVECVEYDKSELKIGIISINTHTSVLNFACPLHSLVFSKVLGNLGYNNVMILDYYPVYYPKNLDFKYPLITALKRRESEEKKKLVKKWTRLFYDRIERFEKFENFIDTHYNSSKNPYTGELLDTLEEAEGINCYIVATDTVWKRYAGGFDKGFLLASRAMFDAYKIAYSVSRGGGKYRKDVEKEFLSLIRNIDDISVREESFSKYISSISGNEIEPSIVLDPVFLIGKEFYQSLMIHPKKKNYILLYLMQGDINLAKQAVEFAKKNNLNLIELSTFDKYKKKFGYSRHEVIYNIGIEEWLGYINDAEYIFTNSFHGSCLSIILEKQFFLGGKRGGDKTTFLIERFNLQSRKIEQAFDEEGEILIENIDYNAVHNKYEEQLKVSMKFLENALKNASKFVAARKNTNKDYFTTGDKYLCTNCTACEKICPDNAIEMVQDIEGFYFPEINDENCTKCGLCQKTCPYNKKTELYENPLKVYLGHNNKEEDRVKSSSGGIFAAMADYFLKNGGVVVGVRFNEKWEAIYDVAETEEECLALRYSKYVQARDNNVYIKTKKILEEGREVLFTGNPCKIAGLLNYLGKEYENLYCADILCHGTNSPIMLSKYLEEKQQNKQLKHFQFRSPHAPQGPVTVEYVYEDGKREISNKRDDLYMGAFLKNVMLKRSCYECKYCGNNGISDITFGDFWGGKKLYKGNDAKKGLSCVKINTPKGDKLYNKLDVYSQEQTVEEMYAKNHKRPAKFPIQRNKIFHWINRENMTVADAMARAIEEIENKKK